MDNKLSITISTNKSISLPLENFSNVTVEEIERLLKIYLFIPKESRDMALAILGGMAVSSNGGKQEEIFSLLIPRK